MGENIFKIVLALLLTANLLKTNILAYSESIGRKSLTSLGYCKTKYLSI